MQPEKFLRDLESSRKRRKIFQHLGVSAIFSACFLFIGPLVHEAAHVAVLELYGCFHTLKLDFSLLSGLHARVKPLCQVSDARLLLFYSVGYLATIVSGALTGMAAVQDRKGSRYLGAASSGLLLSVLLSIGAEGDIQNAVQVFGLGPSYSLAIVLLIITGVFLSSLRTIQLFMGLEREERD